MTRRHEYLYPSWRGIVVGSLAGCIPALLASWALAAGRVSYKAGGRIVFTRDGDPLGFWIILGVLCLAIFLLWGKTIIDLITLVRSHGSNAHRRSRPNQPMQRTPTRRSPHVSHD
jgi:uncharacterized membrane protein